MRSFNRYLIFFIAILFSLTSAKESLIDQYRILKNLKSSLDVAQKYFPKEYTVPVYIDGEVADQILATVDSLGIEKPHFQEHLDKDKNFRLLLSNKNYTSSTREMLSGILNPIEMMDAVLKSVLRFSDESMLKKLQKKTLLKKENFTEDNQKLIRLTLVPKSSRFSYTYKDMGAYIFENWLTKLTVIIYENSNQIKELQYTRFSRLTDAGATTRVTPKKSEHKYNFKYIKVKGINMPSALRFYVNGKPTVALSVKYREEGAYTLFDSRSVKYILDGGKSVMLNLSYGKYKYEAPQKNSGEITANPKYAKKLRKAAELSKKASLAISEGELTSATHILKNVISRYPGTPQAVEAKNILSGLFGRGEF